MPFQISPAIPIIIDGRRLKGQQGTYENTVSTLVQKLCAKSRVGKAIIDEIVTTSMRGRESTFVTIEPQEAPTIEVISIGPEKREGWNDVGGYFGVKFGGLLPENRYKPSQITNPQSARILFSPGFGARARRVVPGAWASMDDESSLLHELFHAVRLLQGKSETGKPLSQKQQVDAFQDREELYATIVQNIYRSEQGIHSLRIDYNNNAVAGNYLSGRKIADEYNFEMSALVWTMCRFAHTVGQIQCKYNPIRDYIQKNPTAVEFQEAHRGRCESFK